jgi:hypothetical protein
VDGTTLDWIWRSAVRVVIAALVGAAFHAAWVVLFIFAASRDAPGFVRGVLWLIVPVVTATGFALGLALLPRREPEPGTDFTRAFLTALSGCAIGGVVMSPIGPMFVGLGVLGGGTVAVAIRVALDRLRKGRSVGVA